MGVLTASIEEYEDITGFPLTSYLSSYRDFVNVDSPLITLYYSGISSTPDMPAFNELERLLKVAARLNEVTTSFRTSLQRADFWELIALIEDIRGRLWTIDNSSRWLRSSITKNNFSPTQEVDYITNARQTLEQVASDVGGSDDRDNDWIRLALRNDLREEDYTTQGGAKVTLTSEQSGGSVATVVDNLIGENIYGKDIDRKLTFTNSDLKVMTPKQTIRQAVEIYSQLRQGANPEFPEDGIAASLIVGSNYASFTYAAMFRQLFATFQKDDTLKNFKVIKLEIGGEGNRDGIFLEFEIETRMGELLVESLSI